MDDAEHCKATLSSHPGILSDQLLLSCFGFRCGPNTKRDQEGVYGGAVQQVQSFGVVPSRDGFPRLRGQRFVFGTAGQFKRSAVPSCRNPLARIRHAHPHRSGAECPHHQECEASTWHRTLKECKPVANVVALDHVRPRLRQQGWKRHFAPRLWGMSPKLRKMLGRSMVVVMVCRRERDPNPKTILRERGDKTVFRSPSDRCSFY